MPTSAGFKLNKYLDRHAATTISIILLYLLTFFTISMGFFDTLNYPSHDQRLNEYNNGKSWNFITREGYKLYDGEKRLRWASFNIPNLLMLEDRKVTDIFLYGFPICKHPVSNPEYDANGYGYGTENGSTCIIPKNGESDSPADNKWICPTPDEQEDAILSIKGLGGQVARTYTLGFGPNYHVRAPGSFNEKPFVAMDHALALARKHRVRLIIPLINNHDGGNRTGLGNFGDYLSMCQYRNLSANDFYTNPVLRNDFKDIVTFVLERTNTVNGIMYKNDPTILAWQLGNELGGWSGEVPPSEWIIEMASHIKSIARNTLVMDGVFGGLTAESRYRAEVLDSSWIDIFSNHYYYGDEDLKRIKNDANLVAERHGKAFIIGEFGFKYQTCKNIFELTKSNNLLSGALLWSLRYHSRDGGFYTHSEDPDFFSFHVPGFEEKQGFHKDEINMIKVARRYGFAIQGINPKKVPYLNPAAPKPVQELPTTPVELRWVGAAWASCYEIHRTEIGANHWTLIGKVQDNFDSGSILFSDMTATKGVLYSYRITPISVDGIRTLESVLEMKLQF